MRFSFFAIFSCVPVRTPNREAEKMMGLTPSFMIST